MAAVMLPKHELGIVHKNAGGIVYSYLNNPQYERQKSVFESVPASDADIVFLGDSLTAFCPWQEFFSNQTVLNRGIGSDVSEGVLNRLDSVIAHAPKRVFLMIGINDLSKKIDQKVTVDNVERVIQKLQENLPDCTIYLQSVLPVRVNTISGESVAELNEEYIRISEKWNIVYIDLYSHFCDKDGKMIAEFCAEDGVHLLGAGYSEWVKTIFPYIK